MSVTSLTSLSNYIKALGQAYVYTGSTATAGAMTALGATEGEIGVEETFKTNDLKAPEWTGDAIHDRKIDGQHIKITVPLIMSGNAADYLKQNPMGVKGGGFSKPQAVVPTTLLLLPFSDIPTGTLSCAAASGGGAWTPAAPANAVWIWKATVTPGKYGFKQADGGKVIRELVFEAMFDDTRGEGHKLYTIGDPVAGGAVVGIPFGL